MDVLEFIKGEEGFSAKSYSDYKQISYGYGSKSPGINTTITEPEAARILAVRIKEDAAKIKAALTKKVTKNQMTALVSFTYNVGFGNTINIIRRINNGLSKQEVAAAIKLYNKAGGKIHPGLVKRREKGAALFLS